MRNSAGQMVFDGVVAADRGAAAPAPGPGQDHRLFRQHPLAGSVVVAGRELPVPYHVYDGHGTLIAGTVPAPALSRGFDGQDVHPVLTARGDGVMVLFVCRFDRASHGPHLEFQVAALAAAEPGARIADAPEAALAALATRPELGLLSLGLWNDTPEVVAYNRDHLGLGAVQAQGEVDTAGPRMRFHFSVPGGAPLVSGALNLAPRTGAREGLSLIRLMGPLGMLRALRQPAARACVINRKSSAMPGNRRALTLTAPDRVVVHRFDPGRDRLVMADSRLAAFGFRPRVVEHLSPFRFVYLHPDDSPAAGP